MLCVSCGLSLAGPAELCSHHLADYEDQTAPWSTHNRILCDLIHRGRIPARLPLADRELVVVEAPE